MSWPATPDQPEESGVYSGLLYLPCTPENGFMPEFLVSRSTLSTLLAKQPDRCSRHSRTPD